MFKDVELIDAIAKGEVITSIRSDSEEDEERIVTAIEQEDTITTVTISGIDELDEGKKRREAEEFLSKKRTKKSEQ